MRRIAILLYNLLFVPILLILLPGYLVHIRKRGGYGNKALQRLGIFDQETASRIGQQRIWIHAVSVGEVGIALKFASEFHRRNQESRFLISTTTSTGLAILEKSASNWLEPIANPIDFPIITSRLIKRLRPSALLMVEADLWPNRIAACKELGIPIALLNARLSARSEKRFRMARAFSSPFFNQLNLITLTEPEDMERWISLGVSPELLHVAGNIKHDSPIAPSKAPPEHPVFLAASTHEGEEGVVASAWMTLKKDFPNLRLVIAPRHAERRGAVREALKTLGISCRLRSEGNDLSDEALLLDTTGELGNWYPKATVVFVGKSLPTSVNHGGQNMIEPLQAGTPVLIGPHTGNFEPLATHLCEAGAAIRVTDAMEMVAAMRSLLTSREKPASMITAANSVLKPHQGSAKRNCVFVEGLMSAYPQ
jgi:3-deoxy-D-manno-octulosonic-acid transferase